MPVSVLKLLFRLPSFKNVVTTGCNSLIFALLRINSAKHFKLVESEGSSGFDIGSRKSVTYGSMQPNRKLMQHLSFII
uniref:Indigoidine synthase A family protein n=1 Tax=Solanum tuberosum TaxID=4113 RepID=M1BR05_SOLTU